MRSPEKNDDDPLAQVIEFNCLLLPRNQKNVPERNN